MNVLIFNECEEKCVFIKSEKKSNYIDFKDIFVCVK